MSAFPNPQASRVIPRAAAVAWWLGPVIFLLILYRRGLGTWYIADDFAWLSLLRQVHNFHDFLRVMFQPEAQGTIRFLSERGFYLLFEKLFGFDSLPFRICVFVTMAANLALIAWITLRITASRLAGFLAPVLWSANTSLAIVMTWTAAWNEALCSFFLLLALELFIRYGETGRRSFWWWQLVVFTLGFGALELNVIYPALAAAYVLFVANRDDRRRHLLSLIPAFAISGAYFFLHRAVAPFLNSGPYAVGVDRRIFATFWLYLKAAFVPQNWVAYGHSNRSGIILLGLIAPAFAAFCVRQWIRGNRAIGFFLCWFLLALGPMLSLPGHITEYYIMIPTIGLAMAASWGVATAWRRLSILSLLSLVPITAYLGAMVPSTRVAVNYWADRIRPVRGLVLGVAAARVAHPGKAIVLEGVTSQLWDDAVGASAFSTVGIENVYLTPESRATIHPLDNPGGMDQVVLEPGVMRSAITHDQVVVYSQVGDHLRNITRAYELSALARLSDSVPLRIDLANPLFSDFLGPDWLPLESEFRWMPRRATVRLGGPTSVKDRLVVEGYCPALQLQGGPLHLFVTIDGISLGETQLTDAKSGFQRLFVIPASLAGRRAVEVEISVDRTTHVPDGRELGLVVNRISIRRE